MSDLERANNLFDLEKGGFKESMRVAKRPLGRVSDFVVYDLPSRLALIREGKSVNELSKTVEEMTPNTRFLRTLSASDKDLALLDLKMAMFGIIHSGGEPGQKLIEAVKKLAYECDQPESITYEEIIMVNPADDPRLFTNGEVGQAEYDFYHTHRLIEPILENALVYAQRARESLKINQDLGAAAFVSISADSIILANQFVEAVGQQMNPDDFAVFRKYLGSDQKTGLPGPSGAYTFRVPLLDLMLAGEQFPEKYGNSIAKNGNLRFFPREGRDKLKIEIESSLSGKGESLVALNKKLRFSHATPQLEKMRTALIDFRGRHYRGVVKQLPGAVGDPNAKGTSGENDLGGFLRERVKYLKDLKF